LCALRGAALTPVHWLHCPAQTVSFHDSRGRSESAKGIGGAGTGTGAKQAAYAPGERGTEGGKDDEIKI